MQYTNGMNAPLSEVLAAYRARLEAIYGDRLKALILFGSRARGDARADSDIDVMIVLEGPLDRWIESQRTSEVTSEVASRFNVDLARIFAAEDVYAGSDYTFYATVREEGVAV